MAKEQQVKSRKRVTDHGEVFTAEREVKAMCDLVGNECIRIDSRFLEPACGDGNFLAEVLQRKLAVVTSMYKRSCSDWERYSLLALGSLYGVDILEDNCVECRKRLFNLWDAEYTKLYDKKNQCDDNTRDSAKFILRLNIICGNALTLMCVDENQKDTDKPIVFSEWTFPRNDSFIRRMDFTFDEALRNVSVPLSITKASDEDSAEKVESYMPSLFEEEDNHNEDDISKFLYEYMCHYKKLAKDIEGDL